MGEVSYVKWLLLVCFVATAQWAAAQSEGQWRLRKNKDQIQVYSRHTDGSRLEELKAVCVIPGTMSQLVALLSDVDNYKEVLYKTKTAQLLQRVNETRFTYYIVNELPVVQDRDMAVQLTFSRDSATKLLHVRGVGLPNLVPEKKGNVRITDWQADWQVRADEKKRTLSITYTCRVDPGGSIPAWVQNFAATDGVYNSFILIRDSLPLARYQGRTFAFLGN
jgi:hypothetical protein